MQSLPRWFRSCFAQLLVVFLAAACASAPELKAPPQASTVAEVRSMLDSMGIRIPISALAPRQSIELTK